MTSRSSSASAARSTTKRMSPIAPRRSSFARRAVVVDDDAGVSAQRVERPRELWFVTTWTSSISSTSRIWSSDPVDHRPARRPGAAASQSVSVSGQQPRRVAGGEDERLHAASDAVVRRAVNAVLGDDRGDERGRRDVEGGVPRREARGDLGRVAFLDRDAGAGRRREVDGRGRRDDVERDVVVTCEHGERVRPDLVRRVAVRGDPVGAGDDQVDLAARHHRRRGASRRSRRAGSRPSRAPRR